MKTIKLFFRGFVEGFKSFGYHAFTVVNFILLFIVYFTALGLTSLIAKALKKHFLSLNEKKRSYWIKRKKTRQSIEDYKRMF